MAPAIDSNSIRVTATPDANVFRVAFDFSDTTPADPALGYSMTWHRAEFLWNPAMKDESITTLAAAAIKAARRPSDEETIEAALRAKFGKPFVRTDPAPKAVEPLLVKVVTG
jgi:hypothetical protein